MRGQMLPIILVFLAIMLVPLFLGWAIPELGLIIKVFLAFVIFNFVKNIMGNGLITYVVAGILIYIFIIKLYWLFAPGYMLYLIAAFMLSGLIIFGLQKH